MFALISTLLAICVFGITAILLHTFLPSFREQRIHASHAGRIVKTDAELKRGKDGAVVNLISGKLLPKVEKKMPLDRIFGASLRKKYELLGLEEPFEQRIAKMIIWSLTASLPTLILPILTQSPIFIVVTPVFAIIMFGKYTRTIDKQYKERQGKIIRDLPTLIDKMLIALEAGRPFTTTFQQVQKTSHPIMAQLLKGLIANMRFMKPQEAIEIFAKQTGIPIMMQFSAAVKIGIESGYEEAHNYFEMIKEELKGIRKTSLEELTRNKPDKMKQLYILLVGHAFVAVIIAFFQVFTRINEI